MLPSEIFMMICGTIFFLIGMVNLSGTVKKIISVRIKQFIKHAVARPFYGLISGIFATMIFQSSSASVALTIGLVSAGLISFYNSLAIILGADIGTTLTVQFVIWHFTDISPLFISLGGLLWLTGKEKWKIAGEMLFYFGLMFLGLDFMNKAAEFIKSFPYFLETLRHVQHPLLGVGVGIIITGIVQASAIPISLAVLLAQQDLISLENAVAITMGANIGTTFTALLAGSVATPNGLKTAIAHFVFKCTGIAACFLFLSSFMTLLRTISSSPPQQIALAHFLMNLVIVMIFIFLLKPFSEVMKKLLPGKDDTLSIWPEYLDNNDITLPHKALHHVHRETERQLHLVRQIYLKSVKMISDYKESEAKSLFYIELVVKNIRKQIIQYLRKISAQRLSEPISKKIFAYTAMANDIERLGYHALCINTLAFQKADRKILFSFAGESDLREIIDLVSRNLEDAVEMMTTPSDQKSLQITVREERVDVKVKEARNSHLERFHKRLCDPDAGPIFVEMLLHFERISDLCNNISEYMCDIQ